MTPEDVHNELNDFKIEIHKLFGDFKADMQKQFADLMKTIWMTQLSTIAIILVGVGILNGVLYFALNSEITIAIKTLHP